MPKIHGVEIEKGLKKHLDFWKESLENTLSVVKKALNY